MNDKLLQGLDLTNSLVGVLTCFQQEAVALLAVAGTMSHQVNEVPEDCNPLQFLWWPNGDLKELIVRFFLILVSLFYVEVSVTRPVFHIWYCTRGFLFRLKIVLPPS